MFKTEEERKGWLRKWEIAAALNQWASEDKRGCEQFCEKAFGWEPLPEPPPKPKVRKTLNPKEQMIAKLTKLINQCDGK